MCVRAREYTITWRNATLQNGNQIVHIKVILICRNKKKRLVRQMFDIGLITIIRFDNIRIVHKLIWHCHMHTTHFAQISFDYPFLVYFCI